MTNLSNSFLAELRKALESGEEKWWTRQTGIYDAGVVMEALRQRLDTLHDYRFSTQRYHDLFNVIYWDLPTKPAIAGQVFVDVGCGSWNPWGMSMLLLMLGARKCYACDLDPIVDPDRVARAMSDLVGQMLTDPASIIGGFPIQPEAILANLRGFNLSKLRRGDPSGIDPTRLVYRNTDAATLPAATAEADVVMSQAFFEHVADVDGVMREMARVSRPGALGIHGIDSTDHRRYDDAKFGPLDYLTIRDAGPHFFLNLVDRPKVGHWMNRLRPAQFAKRFLSHRFEILDFKPWVEVTIDESKRTILAPEFRDLPAKDLATVSGRFLLQKRE